MSILISNRFTSCKCDLLCSCKQIIERHIKNKVKSSMFSLFALLALFLFIVFNMATVEYGKYHLTSRPQKQDNGWVPFVLISWFDGKDLRSHTENPDKVCATEEEALAAGLEAARAWINNER